jgi:D-alanine--poly(phosphoribitol) ligase subunit 1
MNIALYFFRAAARHPDKLAVDGPNGSVTYAQMAAAVQGLRAAIASTVASRLGVCAERGAFAYAGIQAILSAGRSFVPLNVKYPPQRNASILEQTQINTVLLQSDWLETLQELLDEAPGLSLTVIVLEDLRRFVALDRYRNRVTLVQARLEGPLQWPDPPVHDDEAYIVFTSGSTGRPKGVRVRHANFEQYLANFLGCYPLAPDTRHGEMFELTFDLSIHSQFVTWAVGGTLVPFSGEALAAPASFARRMNLTVWFSVPSMVAYLVGSRQVVAGELPQLQFSFFCGEKLNFNTLQTWKAIAPNSRIVNLYGPTETTVILAHFLVPEDYAESHGHNGCTPAGRLFSNQRMRVVGADGGECAVDEPGVLWLAGSQVSAGYVAAPELTAERFIEREGVVWYDTGDVVFIDQHGLIQYVGRQDLQVKVMGFRIELGEIEHHLLRASEATQAVVDVVMVDGLPEIYAVLPADMRVRKRAMQAELRRHLPAYMLPRRFIFVERMPLNTNGKIDRQALKAAVSSQSLQGA